MKTHLKGFFSLPSVALFDDLYTSRGHIWFQCQSGYDSA